nr:hypothetical protein [Tanacetum cinerariifolium]
YPQSNDLVERANRSLGEGMKARLDKESKDWMEEVPHVLTVVHVWNPYLSALATLPDIDSTLDANDHMQFRFGYDPINDDYKVVKVMFLLGGSHLDEIQGSIKVDVYNLKRGGFWQSVNWFPSHVSFICNIDEVCLDGHLYWNCFVNANGTRKSILELDLFC